MEKSIFYSCDMAHATHPSYEGKSDSEHRILQGKGIVLKSSQNQAYSTSLTGSSKFISLCKRASIPYQVYAGHSDMRTGSTIGPMLCAELGITTVDIGLPMLAMHSARELCASTDIENALNFFKAFFTDKKEG
jgi:aspartyl aminopeptidase